MLKLTVLFCFLLVVIFYPETFICIYPQEARRDGEAKNG